MVLTGGSADVPPTEADSKPAEVREGRHLALLIAISDYKYFRRRGEPGRTDLIGPANDVERMRRSLRRFGFDGDDVRVLQGDAASREGILEGLAWLSEQATDSADVVVLYYSGHGSTAPDRDGDEAVTTPDDDTDEALVPYDVSDNHDPDQLVLDDDLREWLASLGTENVTVIVDACFSGTVTRGAPEDEVIARGPIGDTESGSTLEVVAALDHTLLTASGAGEVAIELGFEESGAEEPIQFGVFTYHLTRALDGASDLARYDEILRRVSSDIASHRNATQTPQLEGDMGARLFNVRGDLPRRQYVILQPLDGGGYEIDAGGVHGVRESALYDVYPPGETAFSGSPIRRVRVDSVGRLVSRAGLTGEASAADALEPGSRAVLARVPLGARKLDSLSVRLDSSALVIGPVLDSIAFASVGTATVATSISRRGDAYFVSVAGGPVGPLASDKVTETGSGSGELGFAGTVGGLCGPLERAFSIEALLGIENPEPPTGLTVELQLVESGTSPMESPAAEDTARIETETAHYDLYARVTAPENSVLYFTAAVAGYIGAPFVIWPRGGGHMNQPFTLNRWVRVLESAPAVLPAGVEVIAAVASSDQYDLRSLLDSMKGLCVETGDRGLGDADSNDAAVTGWTSTTRHIVFVDNGGR